MHRMRHSVSCVPKVLLSILVLTVFISGVAAANETLGKDPGQNLINLEVVDADLSMVVLLLIKESNQSIVIADPEVRNCKVTATLKNQPLDTALAYIVNSVEGCVLDKQPDGVYIIRSKSASGSYSSSPGGNSDIAVASNSVPIDSIPRREMVTEKITLYNSSPRDMMWYLGLYTAGNEKAIKSSTYAPPYKKRSDSEAASGGDRTPTPTLRDTLRGDSASAQRTQDLVDQAYQFSGFTSYPGYSTGGGYNTGYNTGYPTAGYNTGYMNPTAGGMNIPGTAAAGAGVSQVAGLLPEGIDMVMPYELDNSLIVRGDEEGIEELKEILRKLDIAPRQIMIKAEFVEISTTVLNSMGINWSLQNAGFTFKNEYASAGNVVIGYGHGNLYANLNAALSESKGKLVNSPIISTMNGMTGTITSSTQTPYLTSTLVYNSQGNPTTTTQVQFLSISSNFSITPRINNADDSITLDISPTLMDSPGSVDTPQGSIPITVSQSVTTTRRIQNGETIVVGGIIRKADGVSYNKIPLLADLPFIGQFFKSRSRNIDDKELLVFITPTIIPEKNVAGTGIGVQP